MDAGTDPVEPRVRVQALAQRWMELLEAFDGGDSGLREANTRMRLENADEVEQVGGPSEALIQYVTRVNAGGFTTPRPGAGRTQRHRRRPVSAR